MQFPNIVTSKQCLECKGCCSFESCKGDWSPRLTGEDVSLLESFSSFKDWRQGVDRIALKSSHRGQACFFLDEKTHHCQVYHLRPYECRLYPFLLSYEQGIVRLYLHLSCPAADQFLSQEKWRKDFSFIRAFFQQQQVMDWVKQHAPCFVDYRPFLNELKFLFDVLCLQDTTDLLKKKNFLDEQIAMRPSEVASMHYSQLFVWKDSFVFDIVQKQKNTLVFARQPIGVFLYWPPLGKDIEPEHIEDAFVLMENENGIKSGVSRIENVSQKELKFFDLNKYEHRQRGDEYVYRKEALASLKGKKYHAKRHEINKLCRQTKAIYRVFNKEDQVACRMLFDIWRIDRKEKSTDEIYQTLLQESQRVHECVFEYACVLGFVGRVVEINGQIKAYTFGYFLSNGDFCVFLEVADPFIGGLSTFIFHMLMKDPVLKDVIFVNTMDDFGMPQVAYAKELWHPIKKEAVYTIYKKH